MKWTVSFLFVLIFFVACFRGQKTNQEQVTQAINAPKLKAMAAAGGRQDFLQAMQQLDRFYMSPEGLQRPQGLSIGGRPDFEGIAAWIFDVYLNARNSGDEHAAAWVKVTALIQQTEEWRMKHPGVNPPPPPQMNSPNALDRGEFMQAMIKLDQFYSSSEGLMRPQG
ncbi:MAG: hypothetical protein ABL958_20425, partial [Bdellovibrionia bacterium]